MVEVPSSNLGSPTKFIVWICPNLFEDPLSGGFLRFQARAGR